MQDAEAQSDQSQMLKPAAASVNASKPIAGGIKASACGTSSAAARSGVAKRDLPEVSVAAVAAVTEIPEAQPTHQQNAPEPTDPDSDIDVEMGSGDLQARNSKEKPNAAPTNKRQKTAGKQTAPRKSAKVKAAVAVKAAEAAAEADTAGSSTDGGSDDDEGDATAAEAAAAADAACFTSEEVTQVRERLWEVADVGALSLWLTA